MTKSFTLIEVIVAVAIIFIIGLTLSKISSQNINTLMSVKEDLTHLDSLAINSTNEFKDINDYSNILDLPKIEYKVEKKLEELAQTELVISPSFTIVYISQKETIKNDQTQKSYFRIK